REVTAHPTTGARYDRKVHGAGDDAVRRRAVTEHYGNARGSYKMRRSARSILHRMQPCPHGDAAISRRDEQDHRSRGPNVAALLGCFAGPDEGNSLAARQALEPAVTATPAAGWSGATFVTGTRGS